MGKKEANFETAFLPLFPRPGFPPDCSAHRCSQSVNGSYSTLHLLSPFPLLWCGTLSQHCRGILCLQPQSSLRFPPVRYFPPFLNTLFLRNNMLAAGFSYALRWVGQRQLEPSVSCTGQPPTASTSPQTPSRAM